MIKIWCLVRYVWDILVVFSKELSGGSGENLLYLQQISRRMASQRKLDDWFQFKVFLFLGIRITLRYTVFGQTDGFCCHIWNGNSREEDRVGREREEFCSGVEFEGLMKQLGDLWVLWVQSSDERPGFV